MRFLIVLISVAQLIISAWAKSLTTSATTCVCTTVPCPVSGNNYLTEGSADHLLLRCSLILLLHG